MNRELIIRIIKELIKEYGSFNILDIRTKLPFFTIGNATHLIYYLNVEGVKVEVYMEKYGDDIVDVYSIFYEDLKDDLLLDIAEIVNENVEKIKNESKTD